MMMMIKGVVPQKSITIIKQSQTDSKHSRPLWDVEGEKRDKIRFLQGGYLGNENIKMDQLFVNLMRTL